MHNAHVNTDIHVVVVWKTYPISQYLMPTLCTTTPPLHPHHPLHTLAFTPLIPLSGSTPPLINPKPHQLPLAQIILPAGDDYSLIYLDLLRLAICSRHHAVCGCLWLALYYLVMLSALLSGGYLYCIGIKMHLCSDVQ